MVFDVSGVRVCTPTPFLQEVLQDEPGQMGFVAPEEEAR